MKLFRGFSVAAAALAFAIAVLGSWVRINNAGLTCPDWPLCHGAIVPTLQGGVVLEWSHRAIALLETFLVVGTLENGRRVRASISGLPRALVVLALIFFIQIALGGATVLLSNSPLSVALHWGTGMALLATLTVIAVLAIAVPAREARGAPATGALAMAAAVAFATMCVGAYVSSSYAGLACPTVPGCGAPLFGTTAAQFAQMLHRLFAATSALIALYATAVVIATRANRSVRTFACAGCALIGVQIALGFANVVYRLPVGLREAHAANAAATFVVFTLAATCAALAPQGAISRVSERTARARPIAAR